MRKDGLKVTTDLRLLSILTLSVIFNENCMLIGCRLLAVYCSLLFSSRVHDCGKHLATLSSSEALMAKPLEHCC